MKKGRSDEKPRIIIRASTLNGDSVGARLIARTYMDTASPKVAVKSNISRTLSFSISIASYFYLWDKSFTSSEPNRSSRFPDNRHY
jgi:hypothetical protein